MARKNKGTDPDLEKNGVKVDLPDGESVTIVRVGTPRQQAAVEKARAPYKSFYLSGRNVPPDIAEKVTMEIVIQGVLLDWTILNDDGTPIPFSKEAARQVLADDPQLMRNILELANSDEPFRRAAVQAAEGNSAASPGTEPNTAQI